MTLDDAIAIWAAVFVPAFVIASVLDGVTFVAIIGWLIKRRKRKIQNQTQKETPNE